MVYFSVEIYTTISLDYRNFVLSDALSESFILEKNRLANVIDIRVILT
jgi:hypothetical protein